MIKRCNPRNMNLITERRLSIKTGTEGPNHDPYMFTEFKVETNLQTVVLHEGLGVWLSVDGNHLNLKESNCYKMFTELTGIIDGDQAYRLISKRDRRGLSKCCKKYGEWRQGYPGEELCICTKCGKVVDYIFNESAII